MKKRTKKLLEELSDNQWHVYNKLPRNIGVVTVRECIDQGLVRTKMVDRKLRNGLQTYRTALRITRRGTKALNKENNNDLKDKIDAYLSSIQT